MEYWTNIIIEKSWNVLLNLKRDKNIKFILIGGWAIYLFTEMIKSKDIDIVLEDLNCLNYFKSNYSAKKNDRLKKYESIIDEISIDIYVPYYSTLIVPCEDLSKYTVIKNGLKLVSPEILLVLKQQAELVRKDSLKGQKDRTDILALLISEIVDYEKYFEIIKEYKLKKYPIRLKEIVLQSVEEYKYCGLTNLRSIKKFKLKIVKKISEY
ncbi:MAG: hypothetical protein ACTSPY_15035 [Candidatus Helarchaeota archaeon]